jgi:hypothetical protein
MQQSVPIDWLDSDYMICVSCDACPFCGYISKSDRIHSGQLPVSHKMEEWVIDGLHLSSEVPREQQCGQKKILKT